ncbi:transcription factor 20 [Silurus meridionalis]|uniref:PHD-type domain-containing protein n=1 Tax=Silurus meridionalis TaxID=175797 RepID=A0A8T0AHK4_SILME|nr:transcription factor 20 [Silurus meridionalis]KAF7690909.1 hypothetical protein HF521_011206 [Silurus meridionalis]
MDPLSRLSFMNPQDHLSQPLDLCKRITQDEDLVKMPRRSDRTSVTHRIRSRCSDFIYESSFSPFNRLAHIQTTNTDIRNSERDGDGPEETPSPLSGSSASLRAVETLSSECSGFGRAESISSAESDVIEVPPSVPGSDGTSRRLRVSENSSHLLDSDVLQDSDSLESRNVASTSETENVFIPTQNRPGSSASSSSSQKRAPEAKRKRARPCKKARANTTKKKKKQQQRYGLSSASPLAFPSHGPEIKLKYTSCKDEKREGRGNAFAPYVHVKFSACTVVNFEEDVQVRKQQRQPAASPGIVPTTSCLQLGRLGSDSRGQTGEVCCLCGRTANAAGLGDLHGPYHPCGADRNTPPTRLLINGHEDDGVKSRETWVHEDCSIWSSGVFLIKGRLYGLEEALRLAQEAVCSCCHRGGATLGCFFKGCSSNYHFPCALQAGCVFNEENFTLRCPKHKNKTGLCVNRLMQNR